MSTRTSGAPGSATTSDADNFQRAHDREYIRETANLAEVAREAPRVSWDTFINKHFRWLPGEHVTLIGPTGQGKTTMLMELLPLHKYVTVLATKPRDSSMDALIKRGYLKLETWKPLDPADFPRRVLWPDARKMDSQETQQRVFTDAMGRMYIEGGWTIAIDELWWVINQLNMTRIVQTFLLQARSLDISLLSAAQRPAFIPREIYSSSTHIFFWRNNDETDLRAISGVGYRSARLIQDIVSNLEQYQALYVNTRTGKMARTTVRKAG